MLRSERSKATLSSLKAVLENISLSGPGPPGYVFSARETCAMFHLALCVTSSFEML